MAVTVCLMVEAVPPPPVGQPALLPRVAVRQAAPVLQGIIGCLIMVDGVCRTVGQGALRVDRPLLRHQLLLNLHPQPQLQPRPNLRLHLPLRLSRCRLTA